jgi:formylglycine-generating enzyme required for sulfatase activity
MPVPGKHFCRRQALLVGCLGAILGAAQPLQSQDQPLQSQELRLDLPQETVLSLVWIPPGEFTMGGPAPLPHAVSGRAVVVRLSRGFFLGQTEVTQQQWTAVMATKPWAGRPGVVDDPQHPAVFFSWQEWTQFLQRLGALTGKSVRMPTEAEWEYACQSGATDTAAELAERVWFFDNAYGAGDRHAMAVGTRNPDRLGLFDMRGNVWEWVADWYDPAFGLPPDSGSAADPHGPDRGSHRVKRGGSYLDFGQSVHCSARDGYSADGRYVNIGARVVVDAD